MSNNQEPLKTNVPDLRDVMEFWSFKQLIIDSLSCQRTMLANGIKRPQGCLTCDELITKIESLGKKEGE